MSRRDRRRPCQGEGVPSWVRPISVPTPYPVGPVTLYLLEGEPLTLVDTGPATRLAWEALAAALAKLGRAPADIRRVLLTHGHHDHFGNAVRFARLGAEVFLHPHDADNVRLQRRYCARWRQLRRAAVPAATRVMVFLALWRLDLTTRRLTSFQPLSDGQTLSHSGSEIRVHHTPGHSPGHVAFELVGEGVFISGDTLLDGITPNAVVDFDPVDPRRPFHSIHAYNTTLDRIEALAPAVLLPAHGRCLPDVDEQIALVRRRQQERASHVMSVLAGDGATVGEVVERIFPRIGRIAVFLAYSEVLGHLLELERNGRARRIKGRRRDRWVASSST